MRLFANGLNPIFIGQLHVAGRVDQSELLRPLAGFELTCETVLEERGHVSLVPGFHFLLSPLPFDGCHLPLDTVLPDGGPHGDTYSDCRQTKAAFSRTSTC